MRKEEGIATYECTGYMVGGWTGGRAEGRYHYLQVPVYRITECDRNMDMMLCGRKEVSLSTGIQNIW